MGWGEGGNAPLAAGAQGLWLRSPGYRESEGGQPPNAPSAPCAPSAPGSLSLHPAEPCGVSPRMGAARAQEHGLLCDRVLGLGEAPFTSADAQKHCRPSIAPWAKLLDVPLHLLCLAEMSSAQASCFEAKTRKGGGNEVKNEQRRAPWSESQEIQDLALALCDLEQSPHLSGSCEAHLEPEEYTGTPMKLSAFLSLLALVLQEAGTTSLPGKERKRREDQKHKDHSSRTALRLENYVPSLDSYDEVIDLSHHEPTDHRDQLPEVKGTSLPPPTSVSSTQSLFAPRTPSSNLTMTRPTPLTRPTTLGLLGSPTSHAKLKRIDLSSNFISSIDDDALRLLPDLKDLILPENQLAALPVLPTGIEVLDVRLNRLRSSGIQPEAFKALERLRFLYLADNLLESIPGPLPLSLRSLHLQNNRIETMQRDAFCDPEEHKYTRRRLEDIRLDGNPINLGLFPSAYFCLPRLPTGRFA
nr:opticin isoform X2 [Equus caballus]